MEQAEMASEEALGETEPNIKRNLLKGIMAHTVMEGISPKIYSERWRPRRAHDVIQSERQHA